MSTPTDERKTFHLQEQRDGKRSNSDEVTPTSDDGTYIPDTHPENRGDRLKVDTSYSDEYVSPFRSTASARREQSTRLEDDLMLLQAERVASRSTQNDHGEGDRHSMSRSRSRRSEAVDEFDEATNPLHEKAAVYKPPENPNTKLSAFVKKIHQSSFIVRYLTYILPVVLLLLIPLLVGALKFKDASVGGVQLMWFAIWLEIVWLTLWAGRVSAMWKTGTCIESCPGNEAELLTRPFVRSLQSVSLPWLVSWPASSPTTRRNGATWLCSSNSMLLSSSGGWAWRFPSCRR